MYTLFFRTIITYILLVGAMRLMGKRQLGELELSELVITMLLSELASIPIADNTIPLTFSLIPIAVLISMEVIISYVSIKSRKVKKIIGGSPSIIINKGRICRSEMEKVRLSLDELISQLRLKDVADIGDVEYAILEENGQISVIPKVSARTVTVSDLGIAKAESGIIHTIVADGQISDFNLKLIGRGRKWLMSTLKKNKCRLEDVFIMSVDDGGSVSIIKKGDTK